MWHLQAIQQRNVWALHSTSTHHHAKSQINQGGCTVALICFDIAQLGKHKHSAVQCMFAAAYYHSGLHWHNPTQTCCTCRSRAKCSGLAGSVSANSSVHQARQKTSWDPVWISNPELCVGLHPGQPPAEQGYKDDGCGPSTLFNITHNARHVLDSNQLSKGAGAIANPIAMLAGAVQPQ